MRTTLLALALLLAGTPAGAAYREFTGTLSVVEPTSLLPASLSLSGSGVAFSARLPENEIRTFAGIEGFTGTATSTSFVGTAGFVFSRHLEVEGVGSPEFTGAGLGLHGPLAVRGLFRSFPSSGSSAARFHLTVNGSAGLGLGGSVVGSGSISPVMFDTWTTGPVVVPSVATGSYWSPATTTLQGAGYDLRTPSGMGSVQLVTPVSVVSHRFSPPRRQGSIVALTVHFAPEPGRGALVAAGGATLLWLSRRRARRR